MFLEKSTRVLNRFLISKTFIIITLVLNSPNKLTILQNFLIVILFKVCVLFIYSLFPKQNYAKNLQVTTQAIGCSVHHQVYYACFLLFNTMWVIFERFILECSQTLYNKYSSIGVQDHVLLIPL